MLCSHMQQVISLGCSQDLRSSFNSTSHTIQSHQNQAGQLPQSVNNFLHLKYCINCNYSNNIIATATSGYKSKHLIVLSVSIMAHMPCSLLFNIFECELLFLGEAKFLCFQIIVIPMLHSSEDIFRARELEVEPIIIFINLQSHDIT